MLAPQSPGTERDNAGGDGESARNGREACSVHHRRGESRERKGDGASGVGGTRTRGRKERPIKSLRSIHEANLFNLIFKRAKTNDF